MTHDPVLSIDDLAIGFDRADGQTVRVVDGVSLSVARGEILGLVGESGSGKSMIAMSTLGLVPHPGRVVSGAIRIKGQDIVGLPDKDLRTIRGKTIGMVFQDPMTGLNPVRTVGSILAESVRRHRAVNQAAALDIAEMALRSVGIPAPRERLSVYPHQLSGGLRQRVMIALALINDPAVIVADEPTTALDATIQAQILDLLRHRVLDESGAGGILITHDLGVAAEICERIAVIYHGRIVETGATRDVLARPRHPYTQGLLAAAPRFDRGRPRLTPIPGVPPGPTTDRSACSFRARCRYASARCAEAPPLEEIEPGRMAACWHPVDAGLEVA